MRGRLTTLRAVILNGYSIEFLVARNTDGDEVSVKFFITHRVPISNSQLCGYEAIMSNDEVILFKIHSVQETISKHENLA